MPDDYRTDAEHLAFAAGLRSVARVRAKKNGAVKDEFTDLPEELKAMGEGWEAKIIEALATRWSEELREVREDLSEMRILDGKQAEQLAEIKASMARHRAWHLKNEWATFAAMASGLLWLAGSKWGWW